MAVTIKWPCCGKYLGHVFKTTSVYNTDYFDSVECYNCRAPTTSSTLLHTEGNGYIPREWCKKIPPLSDEDTTEFLEDLKNDLQQPVTT